MCRLLLAEETGQLQTVGCSPIEQQRQGVREHLAQQPTPEVPRVACPNALGAEALGELAEDGVDAIADMTEHQVPARVRISALVARWSEELDPVLGKLGRDARRVVVAITYQQSERALGQNGNHRGFPHVGWGERDAADDTRPAQSHVHAKAIEGLTDDEVLAEGGLASKAAAAPSPSELANWQREAVDECERRIVRHLVEDNLPQPLLDRPQVRRLADEGRAMHVCECREE